MGPLLPLRGLRQDKACTLLGRGTLLQKSKNPLCISLTEAVLMWVFPGKEKV